jgi:hypothetical protein
LEYSSYCFAHSVAMICMQIRLPGQKTVWNKKRVKSKKIHAVAYCRLLLDDDGRFLALTLVRN